MAVKCFVNTKWDNNDGLLLGLEGLGRNGEDQGQNLMLGYGEKEGIDKRARGFGKSDLFSNNWGHVHNRKLSITLRLGQLWDLCLGMNWQWGWPYILRRSQSHCTWEILINASFINQKHKRNCALPPKNGDLIPHFHLCPIKKVFFFKEGNKLSPIAWGSDSERIFLGIKADYSHPSAWKKNVGLEVEGSHPWHPYGELTQWKPRTPTSPLTCSIHLGEPPTGRGLSQSRLGEGKADKGEREKEEEEGTGIRSQGHGWQHPRGTAWRPDWSPDRWRKRKLRLTDAAWVCQPAGSVP